MAALLRHILTPKVLQRQVRMVANENREFVALQEDRRKQIHKRLKQLDKEIANIFSAIAEYGPTNSAFGMEIERRQREIDLLQQELQRISDELREKLAFVNEPDRIVENALNLRTYLESDDQHSVRQMLKSLISKVSIVNRVATLAYAVPLPRHGSEEPILSERLELGKKTCLSVGYAGVRTVRTATSSTSLLPITGNV